MAEVLREPLDALIAEAKASGGSELANYQLFVIGLCNALGLDRPAMAKEENALNDYVFERRVDFKHPDGTRTAGRIDCYRRGSFILEAKQSSKRQARRLSQDQLALASRRCRSAEARAGQAWHRRLGSGDAGGPGSRRGARPGRSRSNKASMSCGVAASNIGRETGDLGTLMERPLEMHIGSNCTPQSCRCAISRLDRRT